MHPLLASTALGLIAGWPVGVLGFALGHAVERLTDDPRPRAAAWSLAYALPAAALAATVAMTFAPIPPPAPPEPVAAAAIAAPAPALAPPSGWATGLAWSLVGLSAAGLMARGWRWNRGRRRLAAIRAAAAPCEDLALVAAVRREAVRLGVKAPRLLVSDAVSEPLLAGVRRPAILLPRALAERAGAERLTLVCGHELAHLRRGDNWRIPAEEALAGLFWMTPPVTALRGRMLAAREAVCDQYALAGAAPEARRDYARVLVEALRMNALPAPQSAFTGRERSLAALRLSAILQPRDGASIGRLGLVVALGGALTVATGAGSLALASQVRKIVPPAPEEIARIEAEAAADAADVAQAVAAKAAAEVEPLRIEVEKAAEAAAAKEIAALERAVEAEAAAALAAHAAPHPDPDPRPDPQPDPQPDPRLQFEADRAAQRARLAADAADLAQHRAALAQAAALKALGALDIKVDVRPNVKVLLPRDAIEKTLRVKVIEPRVMAAPKVSVNVTLRNEPPMPTPWTR